MANNLLVLLQRPGCIFSEFMQEGTHAQQCPYCTGPPPEVQAQAAMLFFCAGLCHGLCLWLWLRRRAANAVQLRQLRALALGFTRRCWDLFVEHADVHTSALIIINNSIVVVEFHFLGRDLNLGPPEYHAGALRLSY